MPRNEITLNGMTMTREFIEEAVRKLNEPEVPPLKHMDRVIFAPSWKSESDMEGVVITGDMQRIYAEAIKQPFSLVTIVDTHGVPNTYKDIATAMQAGWKLVPRG